MTQTTPKRVLAVIRLSNDTDESTSPERQRALVKTWARANGHVIAGEAEDLDISGKVSPFERPKLGPWLATPERFDVIAVWKLDRLSRNVVDFARLVEWAEKHGKTIVSVTEGFDLSTAMGRMFAHLLAVFAQAELETITERVKSAHAKLRADGRYAGSPPPFGYRAADLPGGGRTLEPDPAYAPILRKMIRDVTDGVSTYEIARRLNADGVLTWKDHRKNVRAQAATERGTAVKDKDVVTEPQRWSPAVVQQIIRNPACCGFKVMKKQDENGRWPKQPQTVYEPDGVTPVMATDNPVVTANEWRAAVAAMTARGQKRERTARSEGMLVGVATCGCCGTAVYNQQLTKQLKSGPKVYSWYRCQGERRGVECANPASIVAELAEQQVSDELLHVLGTTEVTREEFDPGEDFSGEIAEVRQRLDDLENDFVDGRYDGAEARKRYHALHERMTARIDALNALPQRPAASRRVPTGETYAQRWERCDRLERRAFLIAEGFKVVVYGKGETQPYGVDPQAEAVARLTLPTTAWQVVKDGVVQPVGTDPLADDFGTDWTELDMVLRVPPNARLGDG